MTKQSKGYVKVTEKLGHVRVTATNVNRSDQIIKGALAVIALMQALLFGVQALRRVVADLPNKRYLMADIRRSKR